MTDEIVDVVEVIAEQRIREAMERGEFDNLAGQGRPLNLEELDGVPHELRAAYTLLKNNGFAPPEVELRKEIGQLEEALAAAQDPAEARRLRALIEQKSIAYDIMIKKWRRR